MIVRWNAILIYKQWVIVIKCQMGNCSAVSWQELIIFQWDDDDPFVLDQIAWLDFYSAIYTSSLKQQSADRHVTPLRYIIMIPRQPVIALTP